MESKSFKFFWSNEYIVLVSINVREFISSQVHPPSATSFDVFVATVDVVFVVVAVLSLCCC